MLLILLLIFTRNICVFAQCWLDEHQFFQNVKIKVEKLDNDFLKILNDNIKPEENFIYSPLNIYGALALVHLGATSTTKSELSDVLGLPNEDDNLDATHDKLGKLQNIIQNTIAHKTQFNIANAVFIQHGLEFRNLYSRRTKTYYNCEIQQVDFNQEGSEATDIVNKWISDETSQRIPKLFDDEIPKETVILLATTSYFAGRWADSFDKKKTETKTFNTGINQIQVPTMRINESVPYFDDTDSEFVAISVPYTYGEFSMLIVLPHQVQSLNSLIKSLEAGQFSKIIASLEPTYVNYEIPRFKFRWSQDINDHLTKLGVRQMFEAAELDEMMEFDDEDVVVSKVTHAAEIEVDEEGTVASAATGIAVGPKAVHNINPPIPFHANRPFLFSIYHRDTGVILFTGAVQNPSA